jgi:lipoprotein-anchoring transpeptidase ErfK/SrfK
MVKRAGIAFCLTVVCALGAGAAPVLADTPPPEPPPPPADTTAPPPVATIPDGVVLGPVAVGGMTADEAVAALNHAYARAVALRIQGRKVTVRPARFRLTVPARAAVAAALAAAPGTTFGLRATVDKPLLQAFVAKLASRYDRKPVAARLLFRNQRPLLTKAQTGLRMRQGAVVAAVRTALVNGTRAPVAVPFAERQPRAAPATTAPVIVIRRGDNRLTLYRGARVVRTFQVATGQAAYPTPLGAFRIVVMWKNPTWYPPTQDAWAKGLKPVPPGPGNPLGTRWMGLSAPGVGIHGTDEPASIGYSVSHGCIRMQVPQAEWLFEHVTVGTPVFIVPG